MKNFLETLAARGAGLAPRGEIVSLVPRPRARFEPAEEVTRGGSVWELTPAEAISHDPSPAPSMAPPRSMPDVLLTQDRAQDGATDVNPGHAVDAVHNPAPAASDRHHDLEQEASPPVSHSDPEPANPDQPSRRERNAPPLRRLSVAASQSLHEVKMEVSQPAHNADSTPPVDSRVGREQESRSPITVSEPPMRNDERDLPPSEPMPVNPREPAGLQRPGPISVQGGAREPVHELDQVPVPGAALPLGEPMIEPAPSHGPAQPIPAPQTPAPVTVTIGRIEGEIAPSPPPPAARPEPVRTRGFDAYTRARRGQLR